MYRVGDWVFVVTLLVIALTGFLLEGVRIAMDHPGYGGTQFGGWVVAQALTGAQPAVLAGLRHGLWWFHGLLAITFVASIPYTKAAHMLASFMSACRCATRWPASGCAPIPPERAAEPAGYGALADFSPLHLLQLDACTKCGRCHEACPANATGRPLSPRDVILELREQANHAAAGAGIGGVLGALLRRRRADGDAASPPSVIGHDGVRAETVWSCMQCNACVEVCPVGIEQAPIINQLRRRLVEEGELDSNLQSTLQAIHKSGNSFGENRRKRGRWTEELDFEVKDARKRAGRRAVVRRRLRLVRPALAAGHRARWRGCSTRPGSTSGSSTTASATPATTCGASARRGCSSRSPSRTSRRSPGCEFKRIVTTDPHSLNTLRNEYPDLGGELDGDPPHRAAARADRGGPARRRRGASSYRVTYHDPCYLGRLNGGYDAPREILERLGCTLVEMPRNRDNSFCCGAGGGRIWIPDTPGQERPSENRIREAVGARRGRAASSSPARRT